MKQPGLLVLVAILVFIPTVSKVSAEIFSWLFSKISFFRRDKTGHGTVET